MLNHAVIGINNDVWSMKFKPGIVALSLVLFFIFFSVLFVERKVVEYVISILPHDSLKTYGYYADFFRLVLYEIVWFALLIMLAGMFYANPGMFTFVNKVEHFMLKKPRITVSVIVFCFLFITLWISYGVLKQFPNSSDEYVYLYQAETLSQGRLWEKTHSIATFFEFNHLAFKNDLSVGRFPPGWPLVLSIAFLLGISPTLINPLLAALTLVVFFKFAQKLYGNRVALWSMLMLAFTSFYLFNSASYFSHTLCLLAAVLFVYFIHLFLGTKKAHYGLFAGFVLGIILMTRYYTAFLIAIPFVVSLLFQHKFRTFIIMFLWIGVGLLPCFVFLLWYNYSITGNAVIPVTVWAYNDEGLGFVKGHTFFKAIGHVMRRVIMFIYWCGPGLLVLYAIFLWKKIKDGVARLVAPEDYFFLVLLIGYLLYYEIGGNQYGPRFYYEGLPFLIVFVVYRMFQHQQLWVKCLFYAGFIIAVIKIPFIALHEHKIVVERRDVYTLVEKQEIKNALIFIASPTGVIRPMPIGDLTRNDRQYQNDVLYVRDLGESNMALMNYYQGRNFYKYIRDRQNPHGKLIPLSSGSGVHFNK
jgi:hypothetical protein